MFNLTESNSQAIKNYRWRICALLFFATTVNYIDRNVLSFTMIDETFRTEMLGLPAGSPLSEAELGRFKEMMGYVDAAFKLAYALGFIIAGYVIDRIGTRNGFSIAIFVWSLAGIMNGFVSSLKGLSFTRFMLGLGESGNFPSAVKSVAEWFPRRERSFATGLFNAGANIGVIVTAIAVPLITIHYGWRMAFISTGILGIIVLIFWRLMYYQPDSHPKVTTTELDYIQSDLETPSMPFKWKQVFGMRQTWTFAIGKLMTDPIWYFYLTWLPDFFNSNEALDEKLNLKSIGLPFIIIYLVSDVGSIFFGWLSSQLIQKGWSVNKARKITMLCCALCVVPIVFASTTSSIYVAIGLIALAAAGHQGWSANIFAVATDLFPKQAVGSVVGIGSMMGAITGTLFAASTGIIRVKFGYIPLFAVAGGAYLAALLMIQLLSPGLKPASLNKTHT